MKKSSLLRILRVMARFCALSLGLFLVLLVGAFVLTYLFRGNLINYYRRQVELSLNVNIDIHRSNLTGRTLTLEGVQIQTRGGLPLARIEKVVAPLHPYDGLKYGLSRWVSDVQLTRPNLIVSYGSDGHLNWDSVTLPKRLAELPLTSSYRGRIQVSEATLSVQDQRQGDYRAQLDQIQLDLNWLPQREWTAQGQAQGGAIGYRAFAKNTQPLQIDLEVKNLALDDYLTHPWLFNRLRVEGSQANGSLHARLSLQDPSTSMLMGHLRLAAKELVLPEIGQRFQKLSGQFELLGSVLNIRKSSFLWRDQPMKLQGQIRPGADSFQDPWFKVRLQAGPLSLAQLAKIFPKLPALKGKARLDVLAEGLLQDPSLEGRLTATDLEAEGEKLKDLLADFQLDSNSLHLRRVLAHTLAGEPIRASGWIFRDKEEKLYLKLSGAASQLGRFSPWLAGTEQMDVTALGSLLDPIFTGQARLGALPGNPLGISSGQGQFWLDRQSALLWNGQLTGSGGQLSVPWAVLDYHTGQIAGEAFSHDYQLSTSQGSARVHGSAQFSGDTLTGEYQGVAYLDNSHIQGVGLPALENVSGVVGYQQGELLVPQLSMSSGGDPFSLTGSLQEGRGTFFVESPRFDPRQWLASAPSGYRNLSAMAEINGSSIEGFRLATRALAPTSLLAGPGGDAYAVGRWLPGRAPEFYSQFTNLQVPNQPLRVEGQLATAWEKGHLTYYYGVRPQGSSVNNWIAGNGWMQGNQLHMIDNFLHLPQQAQTPSLHGEGRAYSYFGPQEGPPLKVQVGPPEAWSEGGMLGWGGGLDMRTGRLDNVTVRGRNLNLRQLQSWFGPLQSPQWWQQLNVKVEDALVDVDGQARGTLGAPQWEASLRSSWTRLSRQDNGQLESAAFSWRADAKYRQGKLDLLSLLSPHPQDSQLLTWKGPRSSPPQADWLRSRLSLTPNMAWKGWIRAEAFPMATARWLTPTWLSGKLPSGVLSTQGDGVQIGGSLYEPQLAGRVDLREGRFWTGFDHVAIDEAYVEFASRRSATALSRFHLKSAGLTLDGRGNRTSDGSLTAQLWADDLTLETLNQFGWNTQGWKGTVDMAFSFRDARGVSPEGWLAVESNELKAPMEGVFGIRRLVLGSVDRQLDGIPYTGPGKGIAFRLEGGEVVVDLPPQGAEIVWDTPTPSRAVMEGQLSWRSAMAPNQSLQAWLKSPDGPRFGRAGQPMKLEIQQFGWQLIKQLFALEDDKREGLVSGSLELLGQYYEQHRLKNPKLSGQPLLTARLSDLSLEGPGAVWSGLQLRQPLKLAYSVLPGAGWLRLDPTTLEFFHKVAETGPKLVQGTLKLEAALVAMENPGLKNVASKNPDQQFKASLQDLPVQNLAFLVPGLSKIGGTIRNLDLSSTGPLSQPSAQLNVSAQNVQIQGLNITAAQGMASLTGESPGRMRLNFGEGADELRFLLGAENDLTQSLRFQGQALLDFDRVILMKSPTLVSTLRGWALSEHSEFDLRAQLNDSQMRLFSAIAPDQSQLSGALTGGLQLKGTSAKPELTGSLALDNGGYAHPNLSTPLTGVNMLARFERINVNDAEPSSNLAQVIDTTLGRITLEKLEGNLGGQPFQGKGKAELAGRLPTFLDFQLDGDELPIDWDGLMEGRANVHLNLTGVAKDTGGLKPLLSGRIDIPQATLSLPDEDTRNRLLALSSGRKRWLDYNIDLALGNDVWGGYMGSTIRATGDLKVTPSLTGNRPAVNGELFLSRGVIRIPFYEVNFRIRQGYAYFEDDLIPRLENLEADSTLGTYQLTARFDGKYPKIQADVVSNPPLPESDLRRLVGLGGLPAGNTSTSLTSYGVNTNANNFLVNQGVSILSNMLTGALSQGLGRLLFASEVSFDILPTSEYVVRLAKSLTENDDFLLTFAQVIGTTRFNTTLSQYGFEWRFQPNLLTRITLDNYGQARLWFQGVLRF